MLPDKVRLKISHEQATALLSVIAESMAQLTLRDKQNREKMMIIALLKEVHQKLHRQTYDYRQNLTVSLSLAQAQAIWVAYERGYLHAKPSAEYSRLVLERFCSNIHQKTA